MYVLCLIFIFKLVKLQYNNDKMFLKIKVAVCAFLSFYFDFAQYTKLQRLGGQK